MLKCDTFQNFIGRYMSPDLVEYSPKILEYANKSVSENTLSLEIPKLKVQLALI